MLSASLNKTFPSFVHSVDYAAVYELKLNCLAECDVEYIKSSIDFWMSDRAGDCDF